MKLRQGRQRFRPLTAGETAMARRLFGDAIDYAIVRIYNRRYLPFGLQPRNCAKARDFVSTAPSVTAKAGKIMSVGTSSWLSGQTAAKVGERSFYFLVKGERASANAIVSADRATCTCRLESVN